MQSVFGKMFCCCFRSNEIEKNIKKIGEEEKIASVAVEESVLQSASDDESLQISEGSRNLWMVAKKRMLNNVTCTFFKNIFFVKYLF